MKHLNVIVVGCGIAGLATAIRLASAGNSVKVFEKNNYPGGKLSVFQKEGYSFDAGPSLFTQPQFIEELFAIAAENMDEYFQYTLLPVACKYFYEDGTVINAYANAEKFAEEVQLKTGENGDAIIKYLHESKDLYNNTGTIFLERSLHKTGTLFNIPWIKALRTARIKYLFKTMHQVNDASFTDKRIVQLFDRYATYNGSNPYQAPAMLCMIPHLEINLGTYYPKGGMIAITNALYKLALKKGVQFYFNTDVQRIAYSLEKVSGILSAGEFIPADIVVSNSDVYYTYKNLLNDDTMAAKLLKQERSSSAVVFYWGISKEFEELDLHNIFFSTDYKAEFDHLFQNKKIYNDPTVYINITSKCEPGIHAPAGKENWFVMINAPCNTNQDWEEMVTELRSNVIAKLNRMLKTNLEEYIETETILDPPGIDAATASFMGALYGTSSNYKKSAFLRHPNFSNTIKGLYFAGGSVHPGGGIPLCLQSAKIACELIQKDMQ